MASSFCRSPRTRDRAAIRLHRIRRNLERALNSEIAWKSGQSRRTRPNEKCTSRKLSFKRSPAAEPIVFSDQKRSFFSRYMKRLASPYRRRPKRNRVFLDRVIEQSKSPPETFSDLLTAERCPAAKIEIVRGDVLGWMEAPPPFGDLSLQNFRSFFRSLVFKCEEIAGHAGKFLAPLQAIVAMFSRLTRCEACRRRLARGHG